MSASFFIYPFLCHGSYRIENTACENGKKVKFSSGCAASRRKTGKRSRTVRRAGVETRTSPSANHGVSFVHDEAPRCRTQGRTAHFVKDGSLSSLKARKRRDVSCGSLIGKLGHAMRRKKLSAVELVQIYLDRVS